MNFRPLKTIVNFSIPVNIILGILPFFINLKKETIRVTKWNTTIQIVWLLLVIMFSPVLLKKYFFNHEMPKVNTIKHFIMIFSDNFNGSLQHFTIILFWFCKRHRLVAMIKDMFQLKRSCFQKISLRPLELDFILKNSVINLYFVFFLINEIMIEFNKPLFHGVTGFLNYFMPVYVLRISASHLYAGIAFYNYYFAVLNESLEKKVERFNVNRKLEKPFLTTFQTNWKFSQFIDDICVIHGRLTRLTRTYNGIFNMLFIMIFMNSYLSIIIRVSLIEIPLREFLYDFYVTIQFLIQLQLYFLYSNVTRSVFGHATLNKNMIFEDVVWTIIYSIEIYTIASVCNRIKLEVLRTGQILHTICPDEGDPRIKNSVSSIYLIPFGIIFTFLFQKIVVRLNHFHFKCYKNVLSLRFLICSRWTIPLFTQYVWCIFLLNVVN